MPQKKNTRQSRAKRGRKAQGMAVNSLVPTAFRTTMMYHSINGLAEAAVATGAYYTYSLTDLFDPDKTGVGSQPTGYDQWSQMYSRFRVTATELTLNFVNRAATPCLAGYFVHTSLAPTSSVQAWPIQRYADGRFIQSNTGGPSTTTFRFSRNIWDLLSLTKDQYMDELDFSQVSGAGPVKTVYLSLYVVGQGASASVNIDARIKYHVELSDPVSLGMS